MTVKHVCGWECGFSGASTASGGVEHVTNVSGATSVVTTGPVPGMISERCLYVNASAEQEYSGRLFATSVASPASVSWHIDVCLHTLPATDGTYVIKEEGLAFGLIWNNADSTLRCQARTNRAGSGFTPTVDTWYCVQLTYTVGTTATCNAIITPLGGSPSTLAGASIGGQTAAASLGIEIGINAVAATAQIYYDNCYVTDSAADHPLPHATVAGCYPNADDSSKHVYNAANDFGDGTGGTVNLNATSSAETGTWSYLANPQSSGAPAAAFVGNLNTVGLGEWLQWTLEDLPGDADQIQGVMLVATSHSASTASNNFTLQQMLAADGTTQRSGAPWTGISADLSEGASKVQADAVLAVAADNAAWTVAKVNDTRLRFSSSDVNPDVFLDGACLEVAYTVTSGQSPPAGLATGAGAAYEPDAALTVPADLPTTQAREARAPLGGVGVAPALIVETRLALAPTVTLTQPTIGLASGAAVARAAQGGVGPIAGLAAATGAAYAVQPGVGGVAPLTVEARAAYPTSTIQTVPAGLSIAAALAYAVVPGPLTGGSPLDAAASAALVAQAGIGVAAPRSAASATAYDATVLTAIPALAPAGLAASSGQALDATTVQSFATGLAAGVEVALAPQAGIGPLAPVALVGAAAYDATVLTSVPALAPAGLAAATDQAYAAAVLVTSAAEFAAAAGAAPSVQAQVGTNAQHPTAAAAAYDATVSTVTTKEGFAEHAPAGAVAYDATVAVGVAPGLASASAASLAAAPALGAVAGLAVAAGVAQAPAGGPGAAPGAAAQQRAARDASGALSATPVPAGAGAAAHDATVTTAGQVLAQAGLGAAAAVALDATVSSHLDALAPAPTSGAVAHDATIAIGSPAGVAAVAGIAAPATADLGAVAGVGASGSAALAASIALTVGAGTTGATGAAGDVTLVAIDAGHAHAAATAYDATVVIQRPTGQVVTWATHDAVAARAYGARVHIGARVRSHVRTGAAADHAAVHHGDPDAVEVWSG